jgi:hypothetical protein
LQSARSRQGRDWNHRLRPPPPTAHPPVDLLDYERKVKNLIFY